MKTIGYARVSTTDQTLDAQRVMLKEAGASQIFEETASGAQTERRQLARALAALKPGDTLLVTRLDRLARSTRDLLNTLDAIGQAGASFRSLHDAWADTTTAHGRPILTVLGGLAEFERDLIRQLRARAALELQVRGVHMGRPSKLTPHQQREALKALSSGEVQADIARRFNVHPAAICGLAVRNERDA
ncbi:MAG: recombinase family protein [Hyphomicrobiales bacterium]|nr:MAG: recombinase family protein [Hyphomicrobiales bacterium]